MSQPLSSAPLTSGPQSAIVLPPTRRQGTPETNGVAPASPTGLWGRVGGGALALWWNLALPAIIFLATLLPRLRLAHSLDLVTDESVYIPTGILDLHLLSMHNLTSSLWLINHEAPALPKLIIGLGATYGAQHFSGVSGWLYGARLPAAYLSAFTLVGVYFLARPIFGRIPAALGALVLAISPWLVYFGALAYLDTYLLCFMTLAMLLVWWAARRPWLLPLVGALAGLAFASKYTAAALALPIVAYLAYYYYVVARRRPPWQIVLVPVVAIVMIYVTDPTIWISPIGRLWDSILFQYDHATNGHDVFWNGTVWEHVPPGVAIYILFAKMSLFTTLPALAVVPWALRRIIRARRAPGSLDDHAAFAFIWYVGLMIQFGLMTIIVGTHYVLPLAPPTTLLAAWALWMLAKHAATTLSAAWQDGRLRPDRWRRLDTRAARMGLNIVFTAVIALALLVPPAHGLATVHQAEGYTSEWLAGENNSLQVAYPAYADAIDWVTAHSQGRTTVTLISTKGGLDYWMGTRQDLFPQRIRLAVGTPTDFPHSQYIIWPEHLVQRRFPKPANFSHLIVARIQGGHTTYCYILRWPNPDR